MKRYVNIWLLVGLVMLFVQIVVGGITRLTGSGLSITKWEIVTGTLPPLSEKHWIEEFEEYKGTPQYEKINQGMSLGDFKFIYFWEYIHRFWARVMGFVFLFPFALFYAKGWIDNLLKRRLFLVVVLAGLAASFGWIMVASGLVDRPWVNAYKLSIHLGIGISVFIALLWTFLHYRHGDMGERAVPSNQNTWLFWILVLVGIQIIFGGWMSGMKAALFYPTWPLIGESIIPTILFDQAQWTWHGIIQYDEGSFAVSLIHTLHRFTAYILAILILVYGRKYALFNLFQQDSRWYVYSVILLIVQVLLGIIVLLTSVGQISVLWGVLHQGVAVLLLSALVVHRFFLFKV